jgi:hypothetical protein
MTGLSRLVVVEPDKRGFVTMELQDPENSRDSFSNSPSNAVDNLLEDCKVIHHDRRYFCVNDAAARQVAHAKRKAAKRHYR